MRAAPGSRPRRRVALLAALATALLATGINTTTGLATRAAPSADQGGIPTHITAGSDGNLWFTDNTNSGERTRIGRMTPTGSFREFPARIDHRPGRRWISDITAGADGDLWFTEPGRTNRIGRITPRGAVTGFPVGRSADSAPQRITAGPDGNLWFTTNSQDAGRRIGRMTPTGLVTWFPFPSRFRPAEITAGPDGNLWFTEMSFRGIVDVWGIGRITPAGVITEFPVGRGRPDLFGITPGPDGNVWFIGGRPEYGQLNRLGRITPSGQVAMFSPGAGAKDGVAAITAGPDDNLWFTVPWADRIGRVTPVGTVRLFQAGITRESMPTGITAGPDGNLWFSEPNGHRIGRITPNGTVSEFPPTPLIGGPGCAAPGRSSWAWCARPAHRRAVAAPCRSSASRHRVRGHVSACVASGLPRDVREGCRPPLGGGPARVEKPRETASANRGALEAAQRIRDHRASARPEPAPPGDAEPHRGAGPVSRQADLRPLREVGHDDAPARQLLLRPTDR